MRWDPYEEIRKMEKRMNEIFEEFWAGKPKLLGSGEKIVPYEKPEIYREPFADIIETDDVKINATEDSVEISAEAKHEIKEEKKGYLHRERGYEKFYRFFALPSPVDPNKTKASYRNGVLEITLPKTKATKKTPVRVD